jgi:apolipoprotein N-acyltransferase
MTTTTIAQSKETAQVSVGTRIGIGVALSALTTGMMILAFPPFNVWPLALFCMVPMLVAQYRVLPLKWASLAKIVGTDLWVLWFVTLLFGFNPEVWFIYLVPVVVAVLDYFTTKGTRLFQEQTRYRWFVLHGMADWVGFEMIRRWVPLVRSHGLIGHTLHTQPWLIQPVSIFGVYGLSLLVILLNYALAQGVITLFDQKWRWDEVPAMEAKASRRWLAIAGIVLVVWVGISLVTLATATKDLPTVRVAAVQSGHSTPGTWDDVPQEERLQELVEQTRAAAQQGAQLVVWPELGVGFDPQVEYTDELRALAAETNAHIVIGYGRSTETESRNAAVVLTPAGEFLAISGKSHIPPGEASDPDGGAYPVYDTSLGQLGAIICHDANFTDSSRILANKGAQLLAIPTLETYIPGFEKMFYVQTLFRAVENRVPTVKADIAYSSAIIDAYGRVVAKRSGAPEGQAFALVEDVALGASNTLYSRLGDWTGWLSLAGMIFFMVYPEVLKKKQKETPKTV